MHPKHRKCPDKLCEDDPAASVYIVPSTCPNHPLASNPLLIAISERYGSAYCKDRGIDKVTFAGVLRVSEKHLRSRHIEHRIRDIRYIQKASLWAVHAAGSKKRTVATAHSAFHHNHLLALPCVQHGHTGDRAARLKGDRIDGVVRADDQCHVGVTKVVVYLVHLQHDCNETMLLVARCEDSEDRCRTIIRYRGFSKQNIALSGHASCDGMDREPYIHALRPQHGRDFGYRILGFRHGHAVSNNLYRPLSETAVETEVQKSYEDDVVGICQCIYDIVYVCLCYLSLDLVVLRGCCRSSASEEDIWE